MTKGGKVVFPALSVCLLAPVVAFTKTDEKGVSHSKSDLWTSKQGHGSGQLVKVCLFVCWLVA